MNKLIYILPISIIAVTLLAISFGQEVEAQHDAPQIAHVKAVVVFEHTATEAQIQNYYTNTIKPELTAIINTYSSNIDNFEVEKRPDIETIYQIGFNEVSGKNIYEFYPKAVFFGDLPDGVTQEQFNDKFDSFISDLKNQMRDQLFTNGADILRVHIHYTTGSIDE